MPATLLSERRFRLPRCRAAGMPRILRALRQPTTPSQHQRDVAATHDGCSVPPSLHHARPARAPCLVAVLTAPTAGLAGRKPATRVSGSGQPPECPAHTRYGSLARAHRSRSRVAGTPGAGAPEVVSTPERQCTGDPELELPCCIIRARNEAQGRVMSGYSGGWEAGCTSVLPTDKPSIWPARYGTHDREGRGAAWQRQHF